MEHSSIKINDLPDEIIIFILRNLYDVEILYSLIGINKRLNTITHDSIFTSHLTLTYFLNDFVYPLPDPILDRFCSKILHEIHHKIKWLNLESTSIQIINLFHMTFFLYLDDTIFNHVVKS